MSVGRLLARIREPKLARLFLMSRGHLQGSIVVALVALVALAALAPASSAVAEQRDALAVAARVDAEIDARLAAEKLVAVDIADDVEFLRRVYLDVTGCVPTAEQATAFLDSDDADKRPGLADELLASERFGLQLGRVWRDWIAPAELPSEGNGGNQPVEATRKLGVWLAEQLNAGKPWDEIVASIVQVDGNLKTAPQGLFFSLVGTDTGIPEPAGATRAVSSLFLGLDLQCAQCHDDPYRDWKQTDFWGAAAFFRNLQATFNGRYFDSVTESFGRKLGKGAKKTNTRDSSPNGSITIPRSSFENAGDVVAARLIRGEGVEAKEKQPLRPLFSSWLVSPQNPYFARAFVNRTWSHLFGRGLVEPIDDMRPQNPPTHPAVLDLLTAELIESGFDIKHLFRCLLNTKAYQRTSSSVDQRQRAALALFGRRPVKLVSADQLYDSLGSALQDPKLDLRTYDPKQSKGFGESSPVGDEYTEFQRLFETDENDSTSFTHGIPQLLALVNHERVSSGGPVVQRLVKEGIEPASAVETLYASTLSRRPTPQEAGEALEYVNACVDRQTAYAGVLWMLLNRSEFLLVR